jgi:toxin FitB
MPGMTYLLDTNVLSETRKRRPNGGRSQLDRGHALGSAACLRADPGRDRAGDRDRVLPVTLPVAAAWGRQQYAQPLPVIDALIAATARVRGMIVVTRNVKDFELAGVEVLNPFTD